MCILISLRTVLINTTALSLLVLISSTNHCASPAVAAPANKSGDWNNDLSKMMNELEAEVKPGAVQHGATPNAVPNATPSAVPSAAPNTIPSQSRPNKPPASSPAPQAVQHSENSYLAKFESSGLARWQRTRMPIKVY